MVLYNAAIQEGVGYTDPRFVGPDWIAPALGMAIFVYCGWPFLGSRHPGAVDWTIADCCPATMPRRWACDTCALASTSFAGLFFLRDRRPGLLRALSGLLGGVDKPDVGFPLLAPVGITVNV